MIIEGLLLTDAEAPPEPGWLRVLGDRIADVGSGSPPDRADAGGTIDGRPAIVVPGFIDAHVHLPQIECVGCDGLDLLDWLDRVIFPAEARWAAPSVAGPAAARSLRRMSAEGTLGFAGYLSSHPAGVEALAAAHPSMPLRGIAGQVLMDRGAPASLLGQPLASAAPSSDGRLLPSINPRFAVSCSSDLLAESARLAGDTRFVQTHLAESLRECELVAALFPDAANYTEVYDARGLLTPRTLLAHALHLAPIEWACIARRDAVVVHCPTANTFLRSGLFDLRAAHDHGVRLALGSDLAAGPDLAMPRVARAMIDVAKLRRMTVDPGGPLPSPAEAWTMITRGNADALGLADAGRLEVGGAADLLVLRPPFAADEHLIGRLLYGWDRRWIETRIVAGALVG